MLYDSQRFSFDENGVITSNLTPDEKKALAWPDEATYRIHEDLLVPARQHYIRRRRELGLNDWGYGGASAKNRYHRPSVFKT